ncbi:MAG: IclR family transcriptional regulator [Chloroflexia bacterium]|nr:IclR family transcriptional regulator [Chloroflexia bacterium]
MPHRTLSTVRNAVRTLDILAERGPLRLTALAGELALGKSTAHLLLQTLREVGMVEYDPVSSSYRVGLRVFEIGTTAVEQGGFGVRLIGAMEDLARRCNESVSMGVLSAGSVLFVQRVESPEVLRADIRPGTRMPLHASASGKALLATMSDVEIDRVLPDPLLPASARLTVRGRDTLLAEIGRIRERGYARQIEEFVDGIAAVATPVFAVGGLVLGALSIAGPITRFDEEGWARALVPAARELSQRCGYRGGSGVFGANGDAPSSVEIGAGGARLGKEAHKLGQ